MKNSFNYTKKIEHIVMSMIVATLSCVISLHFLFPEVFSINKMYEKYVLDRIKETQVGIMKDRLINHVDTIVHPEYRSYIHFEDSLLLFCNQTESLLSTPATPEISYENRESAMLLMLVHLESYSKFIKLYMGLLEYLRIIRLDPNNILYDSFPLEKFIYLYNASEENQKNFESVAKKVNTIINNNTIDDDEKIRRIGEENYQLFHSKTFYNFITTGIDLFSSINSQHREYLIQANRGI